MPKLRKITPASNFADIDKGEPFKLENGKVYLMIDRDPWAVYAIRYGWLTRKVHQLVYWFYSKVQCNKS